MDPQNQNNQQSNPQDFSLNRTQPQSPTPQPLPMNEVPATGQQQAFIPYAAFPATQKREYDPNIYGMIAELVDKKYVAEIDSKAREFEIARVYNKLEIEIFEMSTWGLDPAKQQELQKMTEEAQGNTQNQQETILKIREYMQNNVPDIQQMVNDYMVGFRNQYMAGRY